MRVRVLILSCSMFGCNTLLGIEKAHVDPLLEAPEHEAAADGGTKKPRPPRSATSTESMQPVAPEPTAVPPNPVNGEDPEAALPDDVAPDDDADADDPPTAADDDAENGEGMNVAGSQGMDEASPGDAGGDGPPVVADAGAASLCDKYCEEVTEHCTGDLQQYRDLRQCQTVCELFPQGELASRANENTVACRLRYASNARYAAGTEQSAYCRQAGPGGDGRCGTNCESYCTLMMQVCSAEVAAIYRYETVEECIGACSALPVSDEPYSSASIVVADGNHVQCRLFHVTSAAMLDAEEHCEHAIGITLCEAPEATE